MVVVSQIAEIVENLAPSYMRYEKDKIGLQVGSRKATVDKALVALEVTDEVVREAREKGVQLIISHHPLIFRSLDRVAVDDHIGGLVTALIKSGISLIAAHTNLDRVKGGVSDVLAKALGLEDIMVLQPAADIQMFKLAVFVPKENIEEMIQALGNAGGGIIGDYSHCSFRSEGTGTFYPMPGAKPYLGEVGELNQVEEYRLEILVNPGALNRVVRAMLDVHPYEEAAYDIYEVKNPPAGVGFGRVGNLVKAKTLRECVQSWKDALRADLRVAGDLDMEIKRVAVCGGSGAELMSVAKASGADVFVTGDIKYHTAHDARAMGLAIIDAGHAETERLIVPVLAKDIRKLIVESGFDVDVLISEVDTNPWNRGQE